MTPKIQQQVTPRYRPVKVKSWHQNSARYSYWQRGAINSTTLTLSLVIAIFIGVAVLAFFYLGQVMGTAAQGSDISQLEDRIIELKSRQRELELEGARLRSIQTVEQEVKELNLVSTDRVAYLKGLTDRETFAVAE